MNRNHVIGFARAIVNGRESALAGCEPSNYSDTRCDTCLRRHGALPIMARSTSRRLDPAICRGLENSHYIPADPADIDFRPHAVD